MKPRILAVGMLDHQTFHRDTFFVQLNEAQVMLYEAHTNGHIKPLFPEPVPLCYVTAGIEKFGATYRVDEPVELDTVENLPAMIGKFELTARGTCRLVTRSRRK